MKKEDIEFVDKVREDWFKGNLNKTPITILKDIPSTIHRLICIIDKIQEDNNENR